MFIKTLKHLKRAPVRAVAVLLFATMITMIICTLQASNEAEVQHYEEAYQSVPVTVTVTAPSGSDPTRYYIRRWVLDIFTDEEPVKFYDVSFAKDFYEAAEQMPEQPTAVLSLSEYVKGIQMKLSQHITTINGTSYDRGSWAYLIGMTSLSCEEQLLPEYGCEITWYEGYDESIFDGDEPVCLIPESKATKRFYDNGNGEIDLYFVGYGGETVPRLDENGEQVIINGYPMFDLVKTEYNCSLKIAGTYTAGDEKSIYCSIPILKQVCNELNMEPNVDGISATLADNRRLAEFKEKARACFLEPSPATEQIRWGFFANNEYNEFYDYVLDINDDNLFDLSAILEDSIKFNRTVTLIVVALSAVAGFLVGFLMIRRRKRDILLMRMVGESNARVYVGFALEQMICIVLGIALGGAYYSWHPVDKLALFAIVYFVALTLALVIFMSKKLIRNIKEDE